MAAFPSTSRFLRPGFVEFLREPPRGFEIAFWLLLVAAAVGIRLYLWQLLPTYLWSGDADSYAHAAFRWLDTDEMIFESRRGPIYTLFIAAALKWFGTLNGVAWLQHGCGVLAILAAAAVARIAWGRVALIPIFLCGVALSFYGLPLHLGHLMRNETMLFLLSTLAFSAWWLSLRWNSWPLLFLAAVGTALGTMTKNVFLPLPLFLLAGACWYGGPRWPGKLGWITAVLAGLALPTAALKIHEARARYVEVPQPQAGQLFFGRTAQWTVLDGGIEPELKELIRADIEEYRRRPKLDNNIILKRTAVPHLWKELESRGQTPTDLDRLCRRFALEAVWAHPGEFWRQIRGDLARLHFDSGVKNEFPSIDQLTDAEKYLVRRDEIRSIHPTMQPERSLQVIQGALAAPERFKLFRRLESRAWLFQYWPVLLTTLALPLMIVFTQGKSRLFFVGSAAVWFANMVLLSTVGRPLERYLMPLIPLMFWALSGVIIVCWIALLRLAGGLTPPAASPTTDAPQEP